MNRARILLVDDEPFVLEGLERVLSDEYEIVTATSGADALAALADGGAAFDVIVSDMRMPGMDGAALLARVRVVAPDMTRVLLTGHADTEAAIAAVNDGRVFRFLTKPCPSAILHRELALAVSHHNMVAHERDLLERTLTGAVELLTELLAMSAPALFSRASRIRASVRGAASRLGLANAWECELSALLCLVGCMTLPVELVEKAWAGVRLTSADRSSFDHHPIVAHRLLSAIPRLDRVADIVRRQRGAVATGDASLDDAIALLAAAIECEELLARGLAPAEVATELRRRQHATTIVSALLPDQRLGVSDPAAVPLARLAPGVVLERDVTTIAGAVLIKAGAFVTSALVERLHRCASGVGVSEPIFVRSP